MKMNPLSRKGSIRFWLLLLLVVAATLAVIWFLIPPKYEGYIWIRMPGHRSKLDYSMYMEMPDPVTLHQAEAAMILRDPLVLESALQMINVSTVSSLKNKKDKVQWLRENLRISYSNNGGVIIAAISCDDYNSLWRILLGVRMAYVERLAANREPNILRHKTVENAYKSAEELIAAKKIEIENFSEKYGVSDQQIAQFFLVSKQLQDTWYTDENLREQYGELGAQGGFKMMNLQSELERLQKIHYELGMQIDEWNIEMAGVGSDQMSVGDPQIRRVIRWFGK